MSDVEIAGRHVSLFSYEFIVVKGQAEDLDQTEQESCYVSWEEVGYASEGIVVYRVSVDSPFYLGGISDKVDDYLFKILAKEGIVGENNMPKKNKIVSSMAEDPIYGYEEPWSNIPKEDNQFLVAVKHEDGVDYAVFDQPSVQDGAPEMIPLDLFLKAVNQAVIEEEGLSVCEIVEVDEQFGDSFEPADKAGAVDEVVLLPELVEPTVAPVLENNQAVLAPTVELPSEVEAEANALLVGNLNPNLAWIVIFVVAVGGGVLAYKGFQRFRSRPNYLYEPPED